jgi:30S ribosomal protein 3
MKQHFQLKFLWLEKNLGVTVNEIHPNGINPVTEYFFWPRKDAWEELKNELAKKPWISYEDSILLLNKTTDIINYWQEEEKKPSLLEVQEKYPDCIFIDQFANCYYSG